MVRALLKVCGLGGLLGVANAVSRSTISNGNCVSQKAACELEEMCSKCVAAVAVNHNSREACGERHPELETFCELLGASYCCILDDEVDAQECVNDTTTAKYWECIFVDLGCDIESMPCFDGSGEGGERSSIPESTLPSTSPGSGGDSVWVPAVENSQHIHASASASMAQSARGLQDEGGASSTTSIGSSGNLSTASSSTGCGGTHASAGTIVSGDTPSPTHSVRCIDIPTSYDYSSDFEPSSTSTSAGDGSDITESNAPTSAPTVTQGGGGNPSTLLSSAGCGGTTAPAEALAAGGTPSPTQSVRCIDIPTSYSSSSGSDPSTSSPTSTGAADDRGVIEKGPSTAPTSTPTVGMGARSVASTPPTFTGCGGTPGPAQVVAVGETASPTQSVRCIDIPTAYEYSSSSTTGAPTTAIATTEAGGRGNIADDTMAPTTSVTEVIAPTSGVDGIDDDDASSAAIDGAKTLAPPSRFAMPSALILLVVSAIFA